MMRLSGVFITLVLLLCSIMTVNAFDVTDSTGKTVSFDSPPDRIVIAGKASVMVTDAVYMFPEASERVIAYEEITQGKGDFVRAVDSLYQRKTVLPPNVGAEQILVTRPDVVLMKSFMRSTLSNPLESLGVRTLLYDLETPQHYFDDIRSIGNLFGNEKRAEEIISYYTSCIERVEAIAQTAAEETKPTALLLYYSERGGTVSFNVPPSSWMQTILIEKAGGVPVWKADVTGSGWMRVGVEQIASWKPDYILITSYFSSSKEAVSKVEADPIWKDVKAVREGNCYAFPSDFYSWDQPDTRWLLGLLWIAKKLHPVESESIDMMGEIMDFYRKLYFLPAETVRGDILPLLDGDIP